MPQALTSAAIASVMAGHVERFAAAKKTLMPAQEKVDSHLRRLAWPDQLEAQVLPPSSVPPPWHQGAWLHVYVKPRTTAQDVLDALRARGLAIERVNDDFAIVQGWITPADVPGLANLDAVTAITPVLPSFHQTGAVTSEGDMASRANLVRALGYDGTGVTVGVISNGIGSLASAQATGDLSTVTVPPGCQAGSGDEGTAMLEIVHDLAPGAPLLFSSGAGGSLEFINSVKCLQAAGARIIVDDEALPDQPFFEDGPAAATVRTAVQAGVSYITSAGNFAQVHVEEQYCPGPDGLHDFSCGTGAVAVGMIVPPGEQVQCFLQWNDPFGGSANNYDLLAVDTFGDLLDKSTRPQDGTQDPFEFVTWTNPLPSAVEVHVGIVLVSGAPRLLDLFCPMPSEEPGSLLFVAPTPGGSIFGHAAVPEVVTAAAIDVMIPGLTTVEPYSSEGPVQIFFPASEMRSKPDLAGFDDVSTTLPDLSPFRGTSAAAPHVAAVAALLLNKNPFLTPAQVQTALTSTADPIGTPTVDVAGTGRLDALAAANAVPVPQCVTDSACNDGNPCNGIETCGSGVCASGTPLNCDDANPCTADACNPMAGCQHTPVADGTACGEGNACTVGQTCHAGACTAGAPVNCDDGIACTADACVSGRGCVHTIADGPAGVSCVWTVARQSNACAGASVPPSADRHVMKAAGLIDSALTTTRPPRARRLFRNAKQTLGSVWPMLNKATRKGKIAAPCDNRLSGALAEDLGRLP
jgi:subtilisin family serine protease